MSLRAVAVTRKTNLEVLWSGHGTLGQARVYGECRGQDFAEIEASHAVLKRGLAEVLRSLGPDRRRTEVDTAEVDRFLFGPDDVVVVVGQDGLVANVSGASGWAAGPRRQPGPCGNAGVLCRHAPAEVPCLLARLEDPKRRAGDRAEDDGGRRSGRWSTAPGAQ